ncbi:MAG: hypothetical protein IPP77_12440 [Bacteroidetes bacterium]|nr:hypothetical protein [Bacteroidota bacterium]
MEQGIFPSKDAEFSVYFNIASPYLSSNEARLMIDPSKTSSLSGIIVTWNDVFPRSVNPDTNTTTVTNQKNQTRVDAEVLLRDIYANIPRSLLNENDKTTLHLEDADHEPTPSGKPTNAPVVSVAKIIHRSHTLRFQNPDDPNSHAKPKGVQSVEVYKAIRPVPPSVLETTPSLPPLTENDFHHVASTGRYLVTIEHNMEDVGKLAYYLVRYKNTRGEFGPFSQVFSAVIA